MAVSQDPTGVLLINLGTPASPRPRDVRRYLREFLGDPRVVDIPAPARWLLLNLVILPFRPRASGAQYAKVWLPEGSPLLVHGRALRDSVARELGPDYVVELGMRYGTPSIGEAVDRLIGAGASRIVALPMFPQYAESSTGSAVAKLEEELARRSFQDATILESFYDRPDYIEAQAAVARPTLERFRPDFVLLSYHGLPERHVRATDPTGAHCLEKPDCCAAICDANRHCYRAHCFATSRALARALDLAPDRHEVSFQSRLGRTPWIQPYTDEVMPRLAEQGVRRLAVMCPAFVADCLETLEEIGIRAREQWAEVGGEVLQLVPSLNAHPRWAQAVADWVRETAEAAKPDAAATAETG